LYFGWETLSLQASFSLIEQLPFFVEDRATAVDRHSRQ